MADLPELLGSDETRSSHAQQRAGTAARRCLRGRNPLIATATKFLDNLQGYGLDRSALWPAFGMTETCAGCTYSVDFPDCAAEEKFANLGTPVHGLRIPI